MPQQPYYEGMPPVDENAENFIDRMLRLAAQQQQGPLLNPADAAALSRFQNFQSQLSPPPPPPGVPADVHRQLTNPYNEWPDNLVLFEEAITPNPDPLLIYRANIIRLKQAKDAPVRPPRPPQ